MSLDWNSKELAAGLQCYRECKFFEAHEHWETVWLKCEGQEKLFLQSLIQLTAAFHHFRRNNLRGAASLLRSSLLRLRSCPESFHQVDVTSLRQEIEAWIKVFELCESPDGRTFPRICITRAADGL